jgi:hypothetical protein
MFRMHKVTISRMIFDPLCNFSGRFFHEVYLLLSTDTDVNRGSKLQYLVRVVANLKATIIKIPCNMATIEAESRFTR